MHALIPFPEISPDIFSIAIGSFEFALRWYALAYIVGILIAWQLAVMAVKRPAMWPNQTAPMQPKQVEDLITWIILGVVLGGRLGFVFFYQPGYYLSHPLEILRIWQGGMAFHGGLLGVVVATWIFAARNNIPKMQMADLVAYTVAPGLMLGRLANFINAELWGRASDLPWSVIFPGHAAQDCGQPAGEFCARHPSQLYEATLEGLLLGALILFLVYRHRAFLRPGLILGVFMAGYGCARFLVEFVRQPDLQFVSPGNPMGLAWQIDGYGLTQGQALSLPMIALGVFFVLRSRRRLVHEAQV